MENSEIMLTIVFKKESYVRKVLDSDVNIVSCVGGDGFDFYWDFKVKLWDYLKFNVKNGDKF